MPREVVGACSLSGQSMVVRDHGGMSHDTLPPMIEMAWLELCSAGWSHMLLGGSTCGARHKCPEFFCLLMLLLLLVRAVCHGGGGEGRGGHGGVPISHHNP